MKIIFEDWYWILLIIFLLGFFLSNLDNPLNQAVMSILIIIIILITIPLMIVLLVHAGRNNRWVWVLLLFIIPFAWAVYYFVHYRKDRLKGKLLIKKK